MAKRSNSTSKRNKAAPVKQALFPVSVSPMLATLVKDPPSDPTYLCEIKWDGYRIISYVQKGKVRMDSRSGLDYTSKYPPVKAALSALKHDVVIDGEVVVFNEEGRPDFDALQKYNGHSPAIYYCVFDLLWLDGENLMQLPLAERKARLQQLIAGHDLLRFSESFDDGQELYKRVLELNLEGVVAKKRDSPYLQGDRSYNWLKIPTRKRQEFIIGAWAESDRGRSFRSLLFGAYNNDGELEWIGRSGGGYKEKEMPVILKKLKALEIKHSPFINKILDSKGATLHYVKPELVANFEFATWTKSGRIRKPATFLGFRNDKPAKDVVLEVPRNLKSRPAAGDIAPAMRKALAKKRSVITSKESNWPEVERQKISTRQSFDISDCEIEITNIEKELWKDVRKYELIQYYHAVAEYLLPHIKDRPQSLYVKLNGPHAPGLYIKDIEGRQPECADIFSTARKHKKEGKRDTIDYLVVNNEPTLLWMINLGCIDVNPWTSRTTDPLHPDYIIIDLDPSDGDFRKAVEAGRAAHQVLRSHGLTAFVKTSGKTGIHIYLPCSGFTFPRARYIAEALCAEIHTLLPDTTTTAVSISQRGNKLYLDPNQNDEADTVAAPYTVRPYHLPFVSTPLEWKELNSRLDPASFNIHTIAARIKKKGELFKDVLATTHRNRNTKILAKLF